MPSSRTEATPEQLMACALRPPLVHQFTTIVKDLSYSLFGGRSGPNCADLSAVMKLDRSMYDVRRPLNASRSAEAPVWSVRRAATQGALSILLLSSAPAPAR